MKSEPQVLNQKVDYSVMHKELLYEGIEVIPDANLSVQSASLNENSIMTSLFSD